MHSTCTSTQILFQGESLFRWFKCYVTGLCLCIFCLEFGMEASRTGIDVDIYICIMSCSPLHRCRSPTSRQTPVDLASYIMGTYPVLIIVMMEYSFHFRGTQIYFTLRLLHDAATISRWQAEWRMARTYAIMDTKAENIKGLGSRKTDTKAENIKGLGSWKMDTKANLFI